jgi:hypothetical protein
VPGAQEALEAFKVAYGSTHGEAHDEPDEFLRCAVRGQTEEDTPLTIPREMDRLNYTAKNAEPAHAELDSLESGPWCEKFPTVAAALGDAWDPVIPFFAFLPEVGRVICAPDAIENTDALPSQGRVDVGV